MPDLTTDNPAPPSSNQIKSQLRKDLRLRRQQLDTGVQQNAAQAVARFSAQLPAWSRARRVALYLAQNGEVDTTILAQACRDRGIELFLPVINDDNSLGFARWLETQSLRANRYAIPEPPPDSPRCPVSSLDYLFIPLLAWDCKGTRLGMGGGYYDRTLEGVSGPRLVGLGHSFQEVPELPREPWDVPLEFVSTEAALHSLPVIA